ncbi:DJ-1/PfpI family protein [Methylobacterium sp. Leaf85]|uniref:DJ-1/PfpI family protein n=1 Tax=Methylobacterium sp. Leaf85 TaxID=1736241 RepID=UPI000A55FC61
MDRRAFTASLTAAVLSGPGEAARAAAPERPPVRIAMLMFPGMTALDLVGPQAILAGLAGDRLHLVSRRAGPVPSDTGLTLIADTSFETCPLDIDVLFVPGGDATPAQMRDAATLAFLRDRAPRASWVTGVCTGSLILGAAGLLDGYRATSHWCVRETVLPRLGAIPVNRRVVVDRNRITAAGISAGLDFALVLAARLRGDDYARTSQLVAEYAPEPPFSDGTPETAGPDISARAGAILKDLAAGCLAAATR